MEASREHQTKAEGRQPLFQDQYSQTCSSAKTSPNISEALARLQMEIHTLYV